MKKIWRMKYDEKGVSPVIATILMVAITVVLAAVLYVMVMGLTVEPNPPPKATQWSLEEVDSATDMIELKLVSTADDVYLVDLEITIEQAGATVTEINPIANLGSGVADAMEAGDILVIDLVNTDCTVAGISTNPTMQAGDINPDQIVNLNIYHNPSGQQLAQLKSKAG